MYQKLHSQNQCAHWGWRCHFQDTVESFPSWDKISHSEIRCNWMRNTVKTSESFFCYILINFTLQSMSFSECTSENWGLMISRGHYSYLIQQMIELFDQAIVIMHQMFFYCFFFGIFKCRHQLVVLIYTALSQSMDCK